MSATRSSFLRNTPSPPAPAPRPGERGLMPELYGLSIGPVRAAYYQQQFQRFESLGRTTTSWNSVAALFTFAWLIARKLWGPALTYVGLVCALVMLWWGGLHNQVPRLVEHTALGLIGVVLVAAPGLLANGLYYHQVRDRTIDVLTHAQSLDAARERLAARAVGKTWIQSVAGVQALVLLLGGLWWWSQSWESSEDAPDALPAVGAPTLVIPSVRAPEPMVVEDERSGLPYHLYEPEPEPEPEALPPEPPAFALPAANTVPLVAGKFYVSAGVYGQIANAERAARRLQDANIAFVLHTSQGKQGTLTSLRIGPFDSRRQAEVSEAKVRPLGIDTTVFQQSR